MLLLKPFKNDKQRTFIFSAALILIILAFIFFAFFNLQQNYQKQNIATGFGFLSLESGFEISESLIKYSSSDNYLHALVVGFLNTLKVALIGNFLAIILGVFLGIFLLSKNFLLRAISRVFVDGLKNVPLLLQLFFWYALFTEIFPNVKNAIEFLPGIFISNRGIYFPNLENGNIFLYLLLALFSYLLSWWTLQDYAQRKQDKMGERPRIWKHSLIISFIVLILSWFFDGASTSFSQPILTGFNFKGGGNLTPEYTSLMLGLVLYTSVFIAEIVKASIEAVDNGQWEAALSLGMSKAQSLRLIILPQAFKVMLPPLTGQFLNLTKNSSLAVAIAYPDFVSVANTTLNQTGQAVELVAMIMGLYLTLSLFTSLIANWFNKNVALRGVK